MGFAACTEVAATAREQAPEQAPGTTTAHRALELYSYLMQSCFAGPLRVGPRVLHNRALGNRPRQRGRLSQRLCMCSHVDAAARVSHYILATCKHLTHRRFAARVGPSRRRPPPTSVSAAGEREAAHHAGDMSDLPQLSHTVPGAFAAPRPNSSSSSSAGIFGMKILRNTAPPPFSDSITLPHDDENALGRKTTESRMRRNGQCCDMTDRHFGTETRWSLATGLISRPACVDIKQLSLSLPVASCRVHHRLPLVLWLACCQRTFAPWRSPMSMPRFHPWALS